MWKCLQCGTQNNDDRDHCWKCSTIKGAYQAEPTIQPRKTIMAPEGKLNQSDPVVASQNTYMETQSDKKKRSGCGTLICIIGGIFMLFVLLHGIKVLLGVYYYITSDGREWVGRETFCLGRGQPYSYISDTGWRTTLYYCNKPESDVLMESGSSELEGPTATNCITGVLFIPAAFFGLYKLFESRFDFDELLKRY